jgi:hypothetical protein
MMINQWIEGDPNFRQTHVWASIIQVYGVKKHKSFEPELLYLWIQ